MRWKQFARLHLIIVLPLVLLSLGVLSVARSPQVATASELSPVTAWDNKLPEEGADPDAANPNTRPGLVAAQLITRPTYSTATLLMEEVDGTTTLLLSPYATTPNTLENSLHFFTILKEGDTYYLWLAAALRAGTIGNTTSIEQRFESQDGLVWSHRTNTNLAWSNYSYKFLGGLRDVIKNGSNYEGWERYFYESSARWANAVRYVTSTDGLAWTVVNQPALVGAAWPSVAKVGDTYHMWENPTFDPAFYTGSQSLRHRTSASAGTGWGDWATGGSIVKVDGAKEVTWPNRVRELADGTFQLFYVEGSWLSLATSADGVNFTTQRANLLDLSQVLSIPQIDGWTKFDVVDVGGEDWFYFAYCLAYDPTSHYCEDSRIVVSRPLPRPTYLPFIANRYAAGFPVHIGDAIPVRPVVERGEVFYTQSVRMPAQLPAGGRFYFSSEPDRVAEALVDDKLAVLLRGEEVFVYNFSTSGHPEAGLVEVPRPVVEQWVGKTLVVEYRDVYASVVEASEMWLVWVP